MSLLTDGEIGQYCMAGNLNEIYCAVEAALIKKLAAGVDVEPRYHITTDCDSKIKHIPHYTPDQLQTAIAAARVKAIEEAAKLCDAHTVDDTLVGVGISKSCADMIRALIGANHASNKEIAG